MGAAIVYRQELNPGLADFFEFVSRQVYAFGETWALAVDKVTLAKGYGKSVRTIQRNIKQLEEKNIISTATKPGKNGGTVIVFNKELANFEPTVNPVMSETLTTEELLDKLYPAKPKKQPKKKYRAKEEIAEERLRKRRRQGEIENLNDKLEETGYPTKEFWKATPEPEKYYKAYLITRMYNFYSVYYPEKIKNESEAAGNPFRFKLGELLQERYRDYDVLPTRFMGTQNFTIALRMVEIFDDLEINPAAYLTVQFNFMEYLLNQGKPAKLPFFNALLSEKSAQRWDDTYEYKQGFREEHPYYSLSPDEIVDVVGYSVPHLNMLVAEYKNPFTTSEFEDYIDMSVDPLVSPKRMRVIHGYYSTIKKEIEKNEDMTEEHKQVLKKWITQQTAIHLAARYPSHIYLIASLEQSAQKIIGFNGDNYRELYYQLGSFSMDDAVDQIELKVRVKHGYMQYFSIKGSSTFFNAMKAAGSARDVTIDNKLLSEAIQAFGERKIPITKYGDLDVQKIAMKHMTEDEIRQESFENAQQITDKQKFLDFFGGMWYDIKEDYVAQSPRDGRKVI